MLRNTKYLGFHTFNWMEGQKRGRGIGQIIGSQAYKLHVTPLEFKKQTDCNMYWRRASLTLSCNKKSQALTQSLRFSSQPSIVVLTE
jgi:hypothetical protein